MDASLDMRSVLVAIAALEKRQDDTFQRLRDEIQVQSSIVKTRLGNIEKKVADMEENGGGGGGSGSGLPTSNTSVQRNPSPQDNEEAENVLMNYMANHPSKATNMDELALEVGQLVERAASINGKSRAFLTLHRYEALLNKLERDMGWHVALEYHRLLTRAVQSGEWDLWKDGYASNKIFAQLNSRWKLLPPRASQPLPGASAGSKTSRAPQRSGDDTSSATDSDEDSDTRQSRKRRSRRRRGARDADKSSDSWDDGERAEAKGDAGVHVDHLQISLRDSPDRPTHASPPKSLTAFTQTLGAASTTTSTGSTSRDALDRRNKPPKLDLENSDTSSVDSRLYDRHRSDRSRASPPTGAYPPPSAFTDNSTRRSDSRSRGRDRSTSRGRSGRSPHSGAPQRDLSSHSLRSTSSPRPGGGRERGTSVHEAIPARKRSVMARQRRSGSIFDKLTDPKLYTGSHATRFSTDGTPMNATEYRSPRHQSVNDQSKLSAYGFDPQTGRKKAIPKFGTQRKKAPIVYLFRNGDLHDKGTKFVIRNVRNMSQLSERCSRQVRLPTGTVRRFYRASDLRRIRNLDEFEDNTNYLCCGGEPLRADRLPKAFEQSRQYD